MGLNQLKRQVHYAHQQMMAFGESKYALKRKAINEGKKWWAYFDKKIFTKNTLKKYEGVNQRFVQFCWERFGIQNLSDIKPRMMKAYVQEKREPLKPNALRGEMSAMAKLGEWVGQSHAFHRVSSKVGQLLPKEKPHRPTFKNLDTVLRVLEEIERVDPDRGLAARFCLESGCRLVELTRLRKEDLRGETTRDGRPVAIVQLTGKGGKLRDVDISVKTFEELRAALEQRTVLVKYNGFRHAYSRAVKAVLGKSGGPHMMRRFSIRKFFGEGYRELRARGLTSWEASEIMNQESAARLGHVRPGITKIYRGR